MTFNIDIEVFQPSNDFDQDDSTFSEAIETVFHNNDSIIKMNWNGIVFEMSIYSCISELYSQLFYIMEDIELLDTGSYTTSLLSSEFTVYWHFVVENEHLSITPEWYVVPNNITENQLSEQPLICHKSHFLHEWKKMLDHINAMLIDAGYKNLELN